MPKPSVNFTDAITSLSSGRGSVAHTLLSNNFNVGALRTNATLRKDEWIQFDNRVVEVSRKRLVGVADLMSAGLSYNLTGNALATTRVEWEQMSDMDPAITSMSGISISQNDRLDFVLQSLPVPIVHKDFNINIRALAASRQGSTPLDTSQVDVAARKVSEQIETTLFRGATVLGSNAPIYGYVTAPQRNTGSLSTNWSTLATGEQMQADLNKMLDALDSDNMFGPYMLYVPTKAYIRMGEDYKANSDKTILQRLKETPNIIDIRPTRDLLATEVTLVQMSSEVVDMVNGLQPTLVEWESHGGMVLHFKVLSIMVPRVRNDALNQSGIAHYSA